MGKKKILVIEDQEDVQCYLMTFLEDNGYETIGASNGREGLDKVKIDWPDLITLDMSMPEMSGVKTLQTLQSDSSTENIPVIIVTGVAEDLKHFLDDRSQLRPPDGYIFKPIEEQELLEAVQRLLV